MQVDIVQSGLPYPQGGKPRTPGVHISAVHRQMALENRSLKSERVEEFGLIEVPGQGDVWWETLSPAVRIKICMGLAWEQWYIPQLGDVLDHPAEYCHQGVYMTPDGESIDSLLLDGVEGDYHCLHEVKVTYKSINTVGNLITQWLWLAQLKAYLKALGIRIAYLHVLYACGDYSRPIDPQLIVYRIIFTQQEINVHWETVMVFLQEQIAQGKLEWPILPLPVAEPSFNL